MAKRKIKLLSTVALNEDLPGRKLKRGEVGTVVEVLAPDVYEVSFVTKTGKRTPNWRSEATNSYPSIIKENR